MKATVTGSGTGFTGVAGGFSGTVNYSMATSSAEYPDRQCISGFGFDGRRHLRRHDPEHHKCLADRRCVCLRGDQPVPTTINLGNAHVDGSFSSQSVAISNSGTGGVAFTEGLNAAAGSTTGQATSNGGPLAICAWVRVPNSAISVGLTNNGAAGAKSGTVVVNLTSNGPIDGLSSTSLGSQAVTINGAVCRYADPTAHTPEPINFGVVHQSATATQALSITNSAANDGYSESLNASKG